MPLVPRFSNPEADSCPGVTQVHNAADGRLARIRIPGGAVRLDQFEVLRRCAIELGDGHLELTTRANIQIRGLAPYAEVELSGRLAAAGLLPSLTHEHVRNIVASPMSGIDGDWVVNVGRVVIELDRAILADTALSALSGRFLFAIDDGRGDVAAMRADVCLLPDSAETARLLLAGEDVGLLTPFTRAVPAILAAAHGFLAERERQRSAAWRVKDLAAGPDRIARRVLASCPEVRRAGARSGTARRAHERVGVFAQPDGLVALAVAVAFGRLTAAQARLVVHAARIGRGDAVVTPWRGLVIPGVPGSEVDQLMDQLGTAGFVTDPASARIGLTTCAGRPGCAKALADVRADAARAVAIQPEAGDLPVHWVACERSCGRPAGTHVEVLATARGYDIRVGDTLVAREASVDMAAEAIASCRRAA
jgi:precorrin-3B synthase